MGQAFIKYDANQRILFCDGEFNLSNLDSLKNQFNTISFPTAAEIKIDGNAITQLDTAGAYLLRDCIKQLENKKVVVTIQHFSEQQKKLLNLIEQKSLLTKKITKRYESNSLAKFGKDFIDLVKEARDYFNFVGYIAIESLRVMVRPKHLRWNEFFGVTFRAGYQALPIIAIMSFMVGVVIAYQTGMQFQKYGANIFVVDLLGFAILREFGPLITAIMVSGRTGSAFTAQLGIMQVNQEIDALNTMGVTPAELLIIPRMCALIIVLPLLTVWADIFGVLGGILTTKHILNISPIEFLNRFQREVPLKNLLIGLGKAPVFAFIIASIGCFQGMRVERNADSVGRMTTRSVVLSIFFIIVADAFFAVLLNNFKL